MSNRVLLALALGLLLMAAPMARGNDNDGYYDDEEEDESAGDDDVLVLGTQNFDEQIAKTKFALVRNIRGGGLLCLHVDFATPRRACIPVCQRKVPANATRRSISL